MAHFLCSYDYEPEYTAEEVEVPFFVLLFFISGSSTFIAVYHRIIIILFTFCFVWHYSKLE